jgi:toxin ParE1/3/4
MSRTIRKSEVFLADFDLQYRWYFQQQGENLARRYLTAIDNSLQKLSQFPELGRARHFPQPDLRGMRSFAVERPFDAHLIFYRFDESHLDAWRIMHGARDLPNRLPETRS